jgi:hypothetical protein
MFWKKANYAISTLPGILASLKGLVGLLDNGLVLLQGLSPSGLHSRVCRWPLVENGLEFGLAEAVQGVEIGHCGGKIAREQEESR